METKYSDMSRFINNLEHLINDYEDIIVIDTLKNLRSVLSKMSKTNNMYVDNDEYADYVLIFQDGEVTLSPLEETDLRSIMFDVAFIGADNHIKTGTISAGVTVYYSIG